MNYFIDAFRNFANINGVLSIKEYWMFILFSVLFGAVASLISVIIPFFSSIYCIVLLIPTITATMRRLRDAGKNPLWILLNFVPVVGTIILIVMLCQPSKIH